MSQLRKHINYTYRHKFRALLLRKNLGKLGERVFVEKNVSFMRFPKNIFIDDNVVIKEGARICACNEKAKIRIGKNTTIGYHNFIFASENIFIGDDCLIAPFVYIVDSNHQIKKDILINRQDNTTGKIKIGNDVWIASNVTILKDVNIGNGVVIAANSVVNCDIPDYEIWGGTPAKKIGERE